MKTKLKELSDGLFGLRRVKKQDAPAPEPNTEKRRAPRPSSAPPVIEPHAFPVESAA